ncbi:hypothetical protein AKJ48_01835 [candidate division MSBL1 archaeon SCGC-AAA261O19]|uniref:Uncharacterized protein n=1 Tax=candidate division MSBL1 archaeon SCGC-AAA261O19 TaxID=1698277 RepID=A0A133VE48_9EURY|nr:hypothetical protein AKJ48_01835 [candidate division MSBL1 archaeon SCGC-AAA261O19]
MISTAGWIVVGIVGLAFAVVLAWLGTLWISTRTSREMSEMFKPRATVEELDEIRRELEEIKRNLNEIQDELGG